MSNVLSTDKKQQVIALGKLGWSLRRIEEVTGVRRETASAYLKAAGVVVCLPGWGIADRTKWRKSHDLNHTRLRENAATGL